jgi:hypothetical protein
MLKTIRKTVFIISALAAMAVLCVYALYRSSVYQQCTADKATPSSYVDCLGPFAHENHGAIVALFTIVLAVSTILLWLSTRDAAVAAKTAAEHIPIVERGYIIGGGPWPTADRF